MDPTDSGSAPNSMPVPIVTGPERETEETERKLVKKTRDEYESARKFDKRARQQYATDRRYASGKASQKWAVSVNLTGDYIDVLCDSLYAKNPDVSARPAPRVPDPREQALSPIAAAVASALPSSRQDIEAFAKTIELVVSRLWKTGRLKAAARKMVRSALSVGPGWIKAVLQIDKRQDPQVQSALNDAQDNLARIQAKEQEIASGEAKDLDVARRELEQQIEGLQARVEVIVRKGLAIDFCRAENMQVSLDVETISDYLDAEWMADATYVPKANLRAKFPRLTEEQCRKASVYAQRATDPSAGAANPADQDGEQFRQVSAGEEAGIEFARVVELWDRRDNHIKTFIDGIDAWAREPYTPPQASTRYYPYFLLSLADVDGERHPQSMSFRVRDLQDEYCHKRSNNRLATERSVPGIIFNAEEVDSGNAEKLERSVTQEFTGIKPATPGKDMRTLFAEKPVPKIDPMLYDVQPILRDFERTTGAQQSMTSSVVQPKTATEADIQQQGFATRSSADRDTLEDVLTDLAQYTAEVAVQGLTIQEVQRIAGPGAFWPHGMDIEDLLTMVEVDITAGSTGKPNSAAERQAWMLGLPVIREIIADIVMARATGNEPYAQALIELLRETFTRWGENIDPERFIPAAAPTPAMPGAPMPGLPPLGTPAPGGAAPLAPPLPPTAAPALQ